ncbi:MAG: hypothetical protein ACYC1D_00815 [Acidimicrobiales bacterium]
MALSVSEAVRVLGALAVDDPGLAETLRYLAHDAAGPDDPFAVPPESVLATAGRVNERRQAQRDEERRADVLDTAAVIGVIASIHDRRGVDRRRRRGRLLGWPSGTRTLHPAWQFDLSRGDTRPGLARVIVALGEVTADAQAADALMRTPRDDLDGRSLAEVFAAGRIETVLRLVLASTDQS